MKFSFIILSIAALLSSCAYENDPGLKPKTGGDNAKSEVKDSLKGKTATEVLNLKYTSAAADCKLEMKEVKPQSAEATAAAVNPPAPTAPVTNPTENEMLFDLKLQSAADPELKKTVAGKLTNTTEGRVVTVALTMKPQVGDKTVKSDSQVFFLKHAPVVAYDYSFTVEDSKGAITINGTGEMYEKVPLAKTVGQSKVTGADGKETKFDHVLTCTINSEIKADSADKEEFAAQFDSIDCAKPPVKGKETLYKDNCN